MVSLRNQIEDVMLSSGCDMVGIANVERFKGAPEGRRPTDILPTARSVIVGAVHILDSVCDDLPETRYEYTNQFYVLNGTLGSMSTKAARLLEDKGYLGDDGNQSDTRAKLWSDQEMAESNLSQSS